MEQSTIVQRAGPRRRVYALTAVMGIASAASIVLLWGTSIPLGIPGEWTWLRIPFSVETAWGWLIAAAGAAAYCGFVVCGGRRLAWCRRRERWVWLPALVAAGFGWLLCVQSAVPGIAGLPRIPFVLYYPRSSGYFTQATQAASTVEFLAEYEDTVAQGDTLHLGTHPPGLTLAYRGLMAALDRRPSLVAAVLATQPAGVAEAAAEIRSNAGAAAGLTRRDEACLWLAALLVQLAAAATVLPIYGLLAEQADRRIAWYAAALWPLAPALAVFLPKSDAMFPLLSMLIGRLTYAAWRKRSLPAAWLAGLLLFLGLLCSLAFLPVALLCVVWTICLELDARRSGVMRHHTMRVLSLLGGAAIGWGLPILLLWGACDINLLRVWAINLTKHSGFYEHTTRSYVPWLRENPLELALAAGAPIVVLAVVGFCRFWRGFNWPFFVAMGLTWGLLWLSGKNMGEAARLWLLLMPWLIVAGAIDREHWDNAPRPATGAVPAAGGGGRGLWISALVLQALVCIATATRVDGFQFAEMQAPAAAAVSR